MPHLDTGILGSLVIGWLPGIVLGSYAASRVSDLVLRTALATVPDGAQRGSLSAAGRAEQIGLVAGAGFEPATFRL